ncbi:MAG: manganese efflux pump MntP family protein, partial [Treponema sp.]|nr:manganese efflux pump MntP family protein [Treponema sp.]
MSLLEIIIIAIGLSMDAFAVSVSLGLSVQGAGYREMAAAGLSFGLFQALMPTAGYFLGLSFADKISAFDHWIAFGLLGIIGGKMIKDSFARHGAAKPAGNPFRPLNMLLLALATSIDALAVGITFAFFQAAIFAAALLTGLITGVISMGACKSGGFSAAVTRQRPSLPGVRYW